MHVRPTAIWCTLFALIAAVANGTACPVNAALVGPPNICDTQFMIACMEDSGASTSVCDLQRGLDTAKGALPSAMPETTEVLRAVMTDSPATPPRTAPPLPAFTSHTFQRIEFLGAAPALAPVSPPVDISTPGLRFSFRIAPHAPPQFA